MTTDPFPNGAFVASKAARRAATIRAQRKFEELRAGGHQSTLREVANALAIERDWEAGNWDILPAALPDGTRVAPNGPHKDDVLKNGQYVKAEKFDSKGPQ